ncbi:MAG: MerR family transcriptional regulator [Glaciihabitans sp.]|nr:MerR family transcriptional regulator [Glaciihabitans sp.]
MRMSQLSKASDVAVATIKFYLREGLLSAGERTSPNQSEYAQAHVDRLRLVRALIEIGGLSVSSVRGVLAAIDNNDVPLTHVFGIAQQALPGSAMVVVQTDDPSRGQIAIDQLIAARGWAVDDGNHGRAMAARVLDNYHALGMSDLTSTLDDYANAALIVAEADIDTVDGRDGRDDKAKVVVVGTVLGDTLFAGLRRMADETVAVRRYSSAATGGAEPTRGARASRAVTSTPPS